MRIEVVELAKLGPMPSSDTASMEAVDKYQTLIGSIEKPVTDEEAAVLVRAFGPDNCFGLMWSLVDLIETAPGWPLADCLVSADNDGVQLLKIRLENAKRLGR
jgi:hypothetical protein